MHLSSFAIPALDAAHIGEYVAAAKDEQGFAAYLEKYIFVPPDHHRYLETVNFRKK